MVNWTVRWVLRAVVRNTLSDYLHPAASGGELRFGGMSGCGLLSNLQEVATTNQNKSCVVLAHSPFGGLSSIQGSTSRACAKRSMLDSDTFQRERSTADT